MASLKENAILGVIWSTVRRFGTLLILFIANLVLARILQPEDFGIIGMIMVFIALSNTLVDGGFGAALIQKKILQTLIIQPYFIGICFFL